MLRLPRLPRSRALEGDVRVLLFALLLPLGALALHRPAAPAAPPAAEPDAPLVARALLEASVNCDLARDLGEALEPGGPRVLLETRALLAALDSPLFAREHSPRELARLVQAARVVAGLARALEESGTRARYRLSEERLTVEDARFLIAALHARLVRVARKAGLDASAHPHAFAEEKLLQFRGLTPDEALARFE